MMINLTPAVSLDIIFIAILTLF